jgi:hypothetical protein
LHADFADQGEAVMYAATVVHDLIKAENIIKNIDKN